MHPDRHVRLILAVFAIAAALLVSRTSGGWQLGLLLAVVVMVVGELRLGAGTTAAHALTDESLQAQDADAVADEPVAAQPSGANPFLTTTARLAAQQVALLDRLQADERDPDRLADLFEMDHLNAMIRQAAALAVIADGGSAPALDGLDAPHIGDVVLGAKARTNHYSRVTIFLLY